MESVARHLIAQQVTVKICCAPTRGQPWVPARAERRSSQPQALEASEKAAAGCLHTWSPQVYNWIHWRYSGSRRRGQHRAGERKMEQGQRLGRWGQSSGGSGMHPYSGKGRLRRYFQQKEQPTAKSLHSSVSSHKQFYVPGAYKVKKEVLRLRSGGQVTWPV